jgi:hypothetical protein
LASASPYVSATPAAPPARARPRLALIYIAVTMAALVPGLLLKIGDASPGSSVIAHALSTLRSALADIQFGSGLRFWLGVAGATMMALLLFYPLRKLFSRSRVLGSISSWFQLHILLGLLGPVCILYHCNFGHGSSNANVALWSMLAVALSGIAGTFAYGRASRDFYTTRHQALQHRNAIITSLSALDTDVAGREALAEAFATFEDGLLTPRRGIVRCILARLRVERSRLIITHMIRDILAARADRHALTAEEVRHIRGTLAQHLKRYMVVARAAASQSIREQVWSRWRMFHVPVFLIMIVAASLHVIAVWDMDAPTAASAATDTRTAAVPGPGPGPGPALPATPQAPALVAPPQLVTVRPKPITGVPAKPASIGAVPARETRHAPPEPSQNAAFEPVAPPPKPAVRPKSIAAPMQPVVAAPVIEPSIETVYAELQKRDAPQPMALGGAKPRTLADQIATLKAQREAKQFFHNDAETGFALTGKHTKVECASCHAAPLREARQPAPRACIACHKKDDVHAGRRPNCAECHTTNRWTQIIRRR